MQTPTPPPSFSRATLTFRVLTNILATAAIRFSIKRSLSSSLCASSIGWYHSSFRLAGLGGQVLEMNSLALAVVLVCTTSFVLLYNKPDDIDLPFLSSRFVKTSGDGRFKSHVHSTLRLYDAINTYQIFRLIPACDTACVQHVTKFLNITKCTDIRYLASLEIIEARCDGYDRMSAHEIGEYILQHEKGVQNQYDNLLLPPFDEGEIVDSFNPKVEKHISDLIHHNANSSLPTSNRYVQRANNLPWNLDRIDRKEKGELDSTLDLTCFPALGEAVYVYILDSGCRASHVEFRGRIQGVAVGRYTTFEDKHGHGTHITGTAAGSSLGVCKKCRIICVKTLDDKNKGSVMDVLNSIDWVIGHRHSIGDYPGVAVLSLGGKISTDLLDNAMRKLLDNGVVPVVAAGNGYSDACTWSPARSKDAITVAASTVDDFTRVSSNGGNCVDIAAPGEYIKSAASNSDTGTVHMSGTSMSAPLVAGTVALLLGENPFLELHEIIEMLSRNSSPVRDRIRKRYYKHLRVNQECSVYTGGYSHHESAEHHPEPMQAAFALPVSLGTPTPSTSPTPTRSPTPTPSTTSSPSTSPSPSTSRTPSSSPTMSPSRSPTPSPSRTPSATPTSSPSVSPSRSPTPSPSGSRSPTPTPSVSLSPTPSASQTPTPSSTPTPSASITPTPTPSVTPTPSISVSSTPSATPTSTPSVTPTPSISVSSTPSSTPTPTPSVATPTPSVTSTPSVSLSSTPSATPTLLLRRYP
eukprot:TRINITY_DN2034_c0_g1_i11.p1 TRINITY_DN2034_c0_g1~~TRINITY_DN2034_c0_g1_i11.p1  ORF type:complete len:749 (-),score=62.81 TRINITY_DN2034_c0_g1_i11:297-2543(-)